MARDRAPLCLASTRDMQQERFVTDAAAAPFPADPATLRARNGELAAQLRTAAMEGDEARIAILLSELLRCQGLSKSQRIALQLKALLNLVHSLRAVTLNDDLTGLYNRHGFVQVGTRLLEVAVRDRQPVHLVCFDVDHLRQAQDAAGRAAGDALLRQTGNLLRDLFPGYGVCEVLGRLSAAEFAALTMSGEYASSSAGLLRARRPQLRGGEVPVQSLGIGVAHFDPQRPVGIEELIANAREAVQEHKRVTQDASPELTPIRCDALNGLGAAANRPASEVVLQG